MIADVVIAVIGKTSIHLDLASSIIRNIGPLKEPAKLKCFLGQGCVGPLIFPRVGNIKGRLSAISLAALTISHHFFNVLVNVWLPHMQSC